jgi:hypothetical protein
LPEPVGDAARQLGLAHSRRPGQPQERRLGRVVHVEERAGELVDRLAVKPRRVDPLPVREQDRLAERLELEQPVVPARGGQVALVGGPVDLVKGSVDRAHERGLLSIVR